MRNRKVDLFGLNKLNEVDVAIMMMFVKIARIQSGHHKDDNWVDIAGYASCGGELSGNAD